MLWEELCLRSTRAGETSSRKQAGRGVACLLYVASDSLSLQGGMKRRPGPQSRAHCSLAGCESPVPMARQGALSLGRDATKGFTPPFPTPTPNLLWGA